MPRASRHCFLHLLRTAQSKPGLSSGFLGIVAVRDQIGGVLFEMEAQFLLELLFHLLRRHRRCHQFIPRLPPTA